MKDNKIIPLMILLILTIILSSCGNKAVSPPKERAKILHEWIETSALTPTAAILEELSDNQSVMLVQDEMLRADTIKLVHSLLPFLVNQGMHTMALSFLNAKNQDDIDTYYLSENKQNPEEILISANATLGYTEYGEFLEYIWNFNAKQKPDEPLIKIVALGTDKGISEKITQELLEETACFLWIYPKDLAQVPIMSDDEDSAPTPVSIVHYGPDAEGLRWSGLVESVKEQRAILDRTFAFKPTDSPFQSWDYEGSTQADIVIVTAFPYRSVTPIKDFVNLANIELAWNSFPEIRIRSLKSLMASRMNGIIRRRARRYRRFLEAHNKSTD